MRTLLYAVAIFTALFLFAVSCGNSGELGFVNGTPVTTGEFLAVFNKLPADMQVSVLEPGGRLELMTRIVMKKALLAAWQEDPSVSTKWEELYSVSMLSDSIFNRIGTAFDQQSYFDSLASCGYSDFTLKVVLLDDSVVAEEVASNWNVGNYESTAPSVSAPWSLADGSSYGYFRGPVHRITTSFIPYLSMETGVAHVVPMYGEWCVFLLDLTEGEWVQDDGAFASGIMKAIADAAPHTVLSTGITLLADNCLISENRVVPAGSGSADPVVLFGDDTLTVNDVLLIMSNADPINFPGEVSSEIAVFSPPEVISTTEVTLWFYVESLAQKYSLAKKAVEQGITLPEDALDFARAESVVRKMVLENTVPDSTEIAAWFENNTDMFTLPERRSVLLGYTDSTAVSSYGTVSGFDDLPNCQTVVDQNGSMVPTPPQIEQAFGSILGPAVFQADSGVFSGPVDLDGELDAWFKVVEIVPPETAELEDVYPQVEILAGSAMFSSGFDTLMEELYEQYSVTIDTAAVVDIDLWGGTQ